MIFGVKSQYSCQLKKPRLKFYCVIIGEFDENFSFVKQ